MGYKRTHNQGKEDGLLYRSVHAGRLPAGHPVAVRILAERQPLIDWHNAVAAALFRPNPLVRDGLPMQKRAKEASKGAPWFSGYAQNFACDVGTKVSHAEAQLRKRIAAWLRACDEKAPEKRVLKRDRDKPKAERSYLHVPEDMQHLVTPEDFAAVAALSGMDKTPEEDGDEEPSPALKSAPWVSLCAAARDAMLEAADAFARQQPQNEDPKDRAAVVSAAGRVALCLKGLNPAQAAIVAHICQKAFYAYNCPVFGAVGPDGTDRFVLRLELDARGYADIRLRDKPTVFRAEVAEGLEKAWQAGEKTFGFETCLLDLRHRLSDKKPHLVLPVSVVRTVWDRAAQGGKWAAAPCVAMPEVRNLALEIGPKHVDVRLNVARARRTPDVAKTRRSQTHKLDDAYLEELAAAINSRSALLGRDFGYVNAVSYGAVRRDRPVTKDDLLNTVSLKTPEQCREHIQAHWHPAEPMPGADGEPVLKHHDAKDFRDCIADHCVHIDRLRAEIDLNFEKMREMKRSLWKPLGLGSVHARIPEDYHSDRGKPAALVHANAFIQSLVDKFFCVLDLTLHLKEVRRDLYRKVKAVKRCWFGWLSSFEADLALSLDAAVAREDTTFVAVPNDDPKYKGRTFNKMLNNGARGQFERTASGKLAWLGIPEVRIPSPYTSRADLRASTVSETKRRGEKFTDAGGTVWHADEHAGLTVAAWLLMIPKKAVDMSAGRELVSGP